MKEYGLLKLLVGSHRLSLTSEEQRYDLSPGKGLPAGRGSKYFEEECITVVRVQVFGEQ